MLTKGSKIMTTYFFSSNGSNTNKGTSEGAAWQSLDMLKTITLRDGDKILLERDSTFDDMITLSKLKTTPEKGLYIGAYGEGEAPVIDGPQQFIQAWYTDNVTVENITVKNTTSTAIYGGGADNWTINNMTFSNNGGAGEGCTISWWNAGKLNVTNSTFLDSRGDAIYGYNLTDVNIDNNYFKGVTGKEADNVQVELGFDISITNNEIISPAGGNSTKGNVVFKGDGLVLTGNVMDGGSFGASISGSNVVVSDNEFSNHTKYSWSSDIILNDVYKPGVISNILIKGNSFEGSIRGLTIEGKKATSAIDNLIITDNAFESWQKLSVFIEKTKLLNSDFTKNTYTQAEESFLYANLTKFFGHEIAKYNPVTETHISLDVSGNSYMGDAVLKIYNDDKLIYEGAVTANQAKGEHQKIDLTILGLEEDDKLRFSFENDRSGKDGDRNLYIHGLTVNDDNIMLNTGDAAGKLWYTKKVDDYQFSSNGSLTFGMNDLIHDADYFHH